MELSFFLKMNKYKYKKMSVIITEKKSTLGVEYIFAINNSYLRCIVAEGNIYNIFINLENANEEIQIKSALIRKFNNNVLNIIPMNIPIWVPQDMLHYVIIGTECKISVCFDTEYKIIHYSKCISSLFSEDLKNITIAENGQELKVCVNDDTYLVIETKKESKNICNINVINVSELLLTNILFSDIIKKIIEKIFNIINIDVLIFPIYLFGIVGNNFIIENKLL